MEQTTPDDSDAKAVRLYSAPALEKGLDILELLHESDFPLSQKEIADRLGRSVSELYRMLMLLVRREYVRTEGERFLPTTKLFRLSQAHPPIRRLIAAALPILEDLSRQTGFGCDLRVYNRGTQTVLAAVDAPSGLGFSVRPGAEIAVGPSASGRVLLAFQDVETMELRIRESLDESNERLSAFRKDLHSVAIKGYAAIKSNQYAGLFAISFPILDVGSNAVAALTVPMLPRIDAAAQVSEADVIEAVRKAARKLSETIT